MCRAYSRAVLSDPKATEARSQDIPRGGAMNHKFTVTIDDNGEVIDIEPVGYPTEPFRTLKKDPLATTIENIVSIEILKTTTGCYVHIPDCRYRKVC
jgi:hypothetical protein